MKKTTYLKATAMFAISLLFICAAPIANAQIGRLKRAGGNVAGGAAYDAKALAKKALKEGKVEIIDCKMEKIINKDGGKIIKITGTAKYIPAKIGKKPLKDNPGGFGLKAYLYDANGKKLIGSVSLIKYGENDQPENVEYKKPFPFLLERGVSGHGCTVGCLKLETYDKADYCVLRGWNTAKTVSSKDSK